MRAGDHLDLGVAERESARGRARRSLQRELEKLVPARGGQARRRRERLREGQRVGALLPQPRVLDRHLEKQREPYCRFKQSRINGGFVHVARTVQNGNFTNWKTVQRCFKSHFLCAHERLRQSKNRFGFLAGSSAAPQPTKPFGTAGPICRTCAQEFRPSLILPSFLIQCEE